jgi:ADP-ribosylation factor-like protein 2
LTEQIKAKEKEIRLLILGLDNAGKTTILKKFCGEPIDTIEPTLGFNIQTLEFKGYSLSLWDVGGQKSIRSYWKNYFESTDGLIWVIDSADRVRMEVCKAELESLLMQEKLAGASLLIFCNKQDIAGAVQSDELEEVLGLRDNPIYKNRHWSIQSCSAVTGQGLATGIDWIISDIATRVFILS